MIGKISMGSSFSGCIKYCLEDKKQQQTQEAVFKNRAELIVFNQCFGDKKELAEQFNDVRLLNQKVQKPVLHITLSLSPEDKLEKSKLMEMARECAKEMGFENNQYIAVSHIDTGHQHLHIVATRIGYDGKVVSDSQNYKKIAQYCRKMELKYNLKQVLSPRKYLSREQRNIPRHDQRKERLQQDIKEVLSKSANYQQFEQRMKEKGYSITKGRGISFTDEKKVKVKGSEVGYSLQKIDKILNVQQQLQQVKEDKARQEQSQKLQPHSTLMQYKQARQESEHLRNKEGFLAKTIDILLKPTAGTEMYVPKELLKQHQQQKKKRRLHL
jgi:diadenosine tetraphosphate (Ap4A) HIT family hydrolase